MALLRPHRGGVETAGGAKGPVVTAVVQKKGDDDEEDQTEEQGDEGAEGEEPHGPPGRLVRLGLLLRQQALGIAVFQEAPQQGVEEDDRKPDPSVYADPLAGDGQAHGDAAQAQGDQGADQFAVVEAHHGVSEHEQVHEHDEKHGENVRRWPAGTG